MNAQESLEKFIFLPELKLDRIEKKSYSKAFYHLTKTSDFEVCPKCATPSSSVYDKRKVTIKDEPIRDKQVILIITKRRFWCKNCYKPFTEPVTGIRKNHSTTERFKRAIFNACMKFRDLSTVQNKLCCSAGSVYNIMREQLEKKYKQHQYPAPKVIGIDEHSLRKPKYKATEYATIIVDHRKKKSLISLTEEIEKL